MKNYIKAKFLMFVISSALISMVANAEDTATTPATAPAAGEAMPNHEGHPMGTEANSKDSAAMMECSHHKGGKACDSEMMKTCKDKMKNGECSMHKSAKQESHSKAGAKHKKSAKAKLEKNDSAEPTN